MNNNTKARKYAAKRQAGVRKCEKGLERAALAAAQRPVLKLSGEMITVQSEPEMFH